MLSSGITFGSAGMGTRIRGVEKVWTADRHHHRLLHDLLLRYLLRFELGRPVAALLAPPEWLVEAELAVPARRVVARPLPPAVVALP